MRAKVKHQYSLETFPRTRPRPQQRSGINFSLITLFLSLRRPPVSHWNFSVSFFLCATSPSLLAHFYQHSLTSCFLPSQPLLVVLRYVVYFPLFLFCMLFGRSHSHRVGRHLYTCKFLSPSYLPVPVIVSVILRSLSF